MSLFIEMIVAVRSNGFIDGKKVYSLMACHTQLDVLIRLNYPV